MQATVLKQSSGITVTHSVTPQQNASRREGQLSWIAVWRDSQEQVAMGELNSQLCIPTHQTLCLLLEREQESDGEMLRNIRYSTSTKEDEK